MCLLCTAELEVLLSQQVGAAKLQHIVVHLLERRGRETIMYDAVDLKDII